MKACRALWLSSRAALMTSSRVSTRPSSSSWLLPNEPRFSCGRSASHFRILRSTETEAPASCKRELGGVLDNGSKATRTFLNQKVPAATAELSPSLGVDGMVVEAANLADALPATRADKCVVRHTVLNHVV